MTKVQELLAVLVAALIALPASQSHAATPGIAAKGFHSVALKSDGSVWTWGDNQSGQIGDGTRTDSHVPKKVDTDYVAISAGFAQTFAWKADQSLYAWGDDQRGQLGDDTTDSSLWPEQVSSDYIQIMPGFSHTVALKSDGSLWTWGGNSYGQLGDGTRNDNFTPQQIDPGPFDAIAVGYSHTVALKHDGTLWTWGYNWAGQLGDGTTTDSLVPEQITPGTTYVAIAAGASHTLALKTGGTLWAWGNNQNGQLGDGTKINKYVPTAIGTQAYSKIAAGYAHNLAQKTDNTLWAWGSNANGQVGDNTRTDVTAPKQIGTATYSAIAAGLKHSLALLKSDSSVWAWGSNEYGQIGDGTTTDSLIPKQISTSATPDTTAPTVPDGVTATPYGFASQVTLSWNAATDNLGVTAYKVYLGGQLAATLGNVTSYIGSSATTDSYTVSACDAAGNCSAQSAPVMPATQSGSGQTLNISPGWNLLGNSVNWPLIVSTTFNNTANVSAVWKWVRTTGKWAFYSPSFGDGGLAYATSQGYAFLTTIDGGDGFWVNAKSSFTAQLPAGTAVASTSYQNLSSGWSLIAVGDAPSASQFNRALSTTPPSPGAIPTNVSTLWSWDKTSSNWFFYAPSLDAKGGTALSDYIASKGYLDFTTSNKKLGPGLGFWVNKP